MLRRAPRLRLAAISLSLIGCGGVVVDLRDSSSTAGSGAVATGGAATGGVSTGVSLALGGLASTGGAVSTGVAQGGTGLIPPCWEFPPGSVGDWKKNYAVAFTLDDPNLRDETAAAALLRDTTGELYTGNGYGGVQPGALQLTIPFAKTQSYYQGISYSYTPAASLDLSHRVLKAYVRLFRGMSAYDVQHPSGAKLAIKTGPNYVYADSGFVNLSPGEWIEVTLNTDAPVYVSPDATSAPDPRDVREIVFEIDTSGLATEVLSPGIVHLDHICL